MGRIGLIYTNSTWNSVSYSIDSKKALTNFIVLLERWLLLTQKAADFILFKEVNKLMNNKSYLSIEGLYQIINLKASMNLSLFDFLKFKFNNFILVKRQIINTINIPNPNWIAGFVTGESYFDVIFNQHSSNNIGIRVQLRFRITQHSKDIRLMECLIKYLGSGKLYKYAGKPAVVLIIFNFSNITNIIIPFLKKNSLLGIK